MKEVQRMNEQLKAALDRDVRENRGAGVDCLGVTETGCRKN